MFKLFQNNQKRLKFDKKTVVCLIIYSTDMSTKGHVDDLIQSV